MAIATAPGDLGRRTYAQRADEVADLVNRIGDLRTNPHQFHETRDEAARAARKLARALDSDGL